MPVEYKIAGQFVEARMHHLLESYGFTNETPFAEVAAHVRGMTDAELMREPNCGLRTVRMIREIFGASPAKSCERRVQAVAVMVRRWREDETRLQSLFGPMGRNEEFSDETEMQRNLGTLIAHANGYLAKQRVPE